MKVAFTSSDGIYINEHFGSSPSFYVWEIGPGEAGCVSKIDAAAATGDLEDRTTARAEALEGCAIVCTVQIGGPAAAKLVARHIHPMKTNSPVPIAEMVEKLQGVLVGKTPPWLRRAAGQTAGPENHLED